MEQIKVSIVMPVYNQEELIIKALNSIPIRNDIEVIIVNDGSTDNTLKSIMDYKNHTKNKTIVLENKINEGIANSVNKGLDKAIGEYIVLLDSDDYLYTKEFNKCLEMLDGTDLIYFDLKINNGDVWKLNEESKNGLCGEVKFIRREFMGDTRCIKGLRAREDYYFYNELLKKNPTEKFSHLVVKHYNFPRENSLYDLMLKGKL